MCLFYKHACIAIKYLLFFVDVYQQLLQESYTTELILVQFFNPVVYSSDVRDPLKSLGNFKIDTFSAPAWDEMRMHSWHSL
jgi:hypothetical protein